MKKHNNALPYLLLVILALIWGSSFVLMKEGLIVLTPRQMASFRITISGLVFLPFFFSHVKRIEKKDLKFALLGGLMGSAIPAFLFAFAQKHIDSSLAGILNSLTPIFTLIIAVVFTKIALSKSKIIGVIIGFIGASCIVIGNALTSDKVTSNVDGLGDSKYIILVILATMLYGANINLIKNKLSQYKAFTIAIVPLVFVSIPTSIILFTSDWSNLDLHSTSQVYRSFGAIAGLAIFGTALSLILFNRLVQISGPVFASSVTYFIPFVALFFGWLTQEAISLFQIIGMILIIIGLILINKRQRTKTPV